MVLLGLVADRRLPAQVLVLSTVGRVRSPDGGEEDREAPAVHKTDQSWVETCAVEGESRRAFRRAQGNRVVPVVPTDAVGTASPCAAETGGL